jgi:hypothetical protein
MKDIEEFSDNHLYEKMLQEDEIPVSINQHDSVSLRSIAISLKRIADALYYEEDGIGITTILTDLADK